MKIRLAAIALGIAVAAAVAWRASRPAAQRAAEAQSPAAELEGVDLRGRDWRLQADAAEVSRDREHVTLRNVRRASLTRNGETVLSITCARLDLNRRTGDMGCSGNVRAAASGGLELETEAVRWEAARQVMAGAAPATIRMGEAAMKVSALSYSTREKRLECTRGVRLATSDSYVSGERMVVLLAERRVHLAGDIRARMSVDEAEKFVSSGPGGAVRRLLSFPPL